MVVALVMVKDFTGVPPKLTAVVPVKFVPVMAIVVPPAVVPVLGDTAAIVAGSL
jgi:hypothetical protein